MAAIASMSYGGTHAMTMSQQGAQTHAEDQYLTTFFCRALYDYRSPDSSSLSFVRGDIIEVLTQLDTGWWDGLLNDERGWFPSNYVQPISEQEAEAEFNRTDYGPRLPEVHDSAIDVSQRVRGEAPENNQWLREAMEYPNVRNDFDPTGFDRLAGTGAANDFWVPRVTQNGQIYYVNTETGAESRDLPSELIDDASDADLAGTSTRSATRFTPAANNVQGRTNGGPPSAQASTSQAGFGISKRSGTPEPWVRRLADDGLTFYYYNTVTGQTDWTRPVVDAGTATSYKNETRRPAQVAQLPPSSTAAHVTTHNGTPDTLVAPSRLRADSVNSQYQQTSTLKRLSVYSDDSDIQPREGDVPVRHRHAQQYPDGTEAPGLARYDQDGHIYDNEDEEMSSVRKAEHSARMLQQQLAPPEPESIESLSELTHDAIIAVMSAVDVNGLPRSTDYDKEVEQQVFSVIIAVRNLLYVSCALSGSLPNNISERSSGDPNATAVAQQLQAQLKNSQRKVTATLSKLVLSARAVRYRRELMSADLLIRVEQDTRDLQRAVDSFVAEVQKQYSRTEIKQLHARVGRKRLRGIFVLSHLGLGIPGAGMAGSWKGLGFVIYDEGVGLPRRSLNEDALSEIRSLADVTLDKLGEYSSKITQSAVTTEAVLDGSQDVLSSLMSLLSVIADINIAQDIDIDGLRRPGGRSGTSAQTEYFDSVAQARVLLRRLEVTTQALYDCGSSMLLTAQSAPSDWVSSGPADEDQTVAVLATYIDMLQNELQQASVILHALAEIGRRQVDSAGRQGPRGSMEWRSSHFNVLSGGQRFSNLFDNLRGEDVDEGEDVVDMNFAFSKASARPPLPAIDCPTDLSAPIPEEPEQESVPDVAQAPERAVENIRLDDALTKPTIAQAAPVRAVEEEPAESSSKNKPQPRAAKIRQLLGEDAPERYIDNANADSKPWYLRSDYNRDDLMLNPDGGIRAGTLPALVERLTSHDYGADPIFIQTFLMTYKSFTTLNELFDLLVQRYNIQPPDGLNGKELNEWTKMKQYVVRSRVLNTFKTMITDEDVLGDDDAYILDRMKDFVSKLDVSEVPAAKTLSIVIERAKSGENRVVMQTPSTSFPPPSIIPKGMNKNKLKLLDIDPLELARQLTLLESALYKKIRAIECLQRAREQRAVGEHRDHITDVIQMTNKIANWVNDTILGKEDSRKRAAIVKQFISIADRCRNLHNYSSMAAIISGLNSPPIRRLKRTWEQVSGRFMSQLGQCEMTLDSTKNFTNYKATLASVNPPCIPFIGVYLTTLTFIQDGSKDNLSGNLVNFGKRQKAAEVIREIKHWQSKDFLLNPLPPILSYIEESLGAFNESEDWGEIFWNLSLEREPREREDEKMARLLQESGFL